MTGEPSDFDPQTLWQSQPTEHDPMTLAEIHRRSHAFEAKVRRRNLIEYVACGLVIAGFTPVLFARASWMMQAGAGLAIAATIFVGWQLHVRASAGRTPAVGDALVDFHRQELIRQRDALRSVGLWYLAPFVPGMTLVMMGRWFQAHAAHRALALDHMLILVTSGVTVLVFLGIWLLNLYGAKRLQQRIDDL